MMTKSLLRRAFTLGSVLALFLVLCATSDINTVARNNSPDAAYKGIVSSPSLSDASNYMGSLSFQGSVRVENLNCPNCLPALVVFSMVREDLLTMLLTSIDLVTEHVFVVCNFDTEEKKKAMSSVLNEFLGCEKIDGSQCRNPNVRQLHVISNQENVGFSGSFNLALKAVLPYQVPFVVFNNDDVKFIPGRLLAAKQIMESTDACMYFFEGFSSFGISARGIANLGSMDENFWPAYGEDCDYWYRAQLVKCRLFYRGGYVPDQSTGLGKELAFVTHGDGEHSSSTTYKSSSTRGKLVANTLDGKRGRFAYLTRKWGFNTCDLYHEVMNAPRKESEVLDPMSETLLKSRGMRSKLPYGTVQDVNSWLKSDWQDDNSISPRGANSRWAPNQTVWQDVDDSKILSLAESLSSHKNKTGETYYLKPST